MIEPLLQDDAFVNDVRDAVTGEGFALWWLGQSGFLLKYDKQYVVFDPYLSDSLMQKYADTDKPHVRMTRRLIDPARLDFVDVVTSSHNHTDHLDAATLGPMLAANPAMTLLIPEANRDFVAERLGLERERPIGLNDGEQVTVGPFTFHGVPAAHETIDRDEKGHCRFMGYVVQFSDWCVYHSGDTLRFDGMAEMLRPFNINVAMLPINGRKPQRRVAGNLDGEQAAQLAHDIGAGCVIPCHYEMFTFNTEPPDRFVAACERLGQPRRVLRCGERYEVRTSHG